MNKENKEMMRKLHQEAQHKIYPSFPYDYIPEYSRNDRSTNGLTACIIDFINYTGGQAERISSTGRWVSNGGTKQIDFYTGKETASGRYIKSSGTKGTADISATINGKSVKIEVKYGKDKMSNDQKVYKSRIENAGGVYMIARTFDSWLDDYNRIFKADYPKINPNAEKGF